MSTPDFKIEVEEKTSFKQKMIALMLENFIIVTCVLVLISVFKGFDISFCILVFMLMFLLVMIRDYPTCAYFIHELEIKDGMVYISYSKNGKRISLEGKLAEEFFGFDKGKRYSSDDNIRLLYQGKAKVIQYRKWEWDSEAFDNTIKYLKQINHLSV